MTKKLDTDDLVLRAKEGRVAIAEIDHIVAVLTARQGGEQTYDLLYVISRSCAVEKEPLVSGFLDHEDDPMVARLALQTLCSFWGLTDRYLEELQTFLAGVSWDVMGDVREVAISAAGDYLRDHQHPELLSKLLLIADPANEAAVERRIAVEALAQAMGESTEQAIAADKGARTWEQWAEGITGEAAKRLAVERP